MAISFLKHKTELEKAFKAVCADGDDTDWAVFGYDGKSWDLKVVDQGEDGIEEMVDNLSGSKCQYAFLRVLDPNTELHKFVLINWSGEGAPVNVKGTCARHVPDVANFLRGAHVTINARSEDDVEEDLILKKVSTASGSNYGFHKEKAKPADLAPSGPIGSVYKRTNAAAEIKAKRSDDFWNKHDEDDKRRRQKEVKQRQAEAEKSDAARRKSEAEAATVRDRDMSDKIKSVDQQRRAEQKRHDADREAEKQRWDEQQNQADSPTRDRSAYEKQQEAAELVARRTSNPRNFFEDKSREAAAPPPPMPRGAARSPISLPKAKEPEPEPEPEPEQAYEPEPEQAYEPEPEQAYEPEPSQPSPPPARSPPAAMSAPQAPYRQDSDEEEQAGGDDEWDDDGAAPTYENPGSETPAAAQSYQEPEPTYEEAESPPAAVEDQVESDPVYEAADQDQGAGGGGGQTATAVYDYQAADDTEITFDPGDLITELDQIDSGWWQGRGPDGSFGMFPANYVEINE